MKALIIYVACALLAISCLADEDPRACPATFRGKIIDDLSKEPIEGAKVKAWSFEYASGFGDSESRELIDSFITDATGDIEFFSEFTVRNWQIEVFKYGYEIPGGFFPGVACQDLDEVIGLYELVTVNVKTIDVSNLDYDSLFIESVPGIGFIGDQGDYGTSKLSMIPDESKEMWYKVDANGIIEYWFNNDPNLEIYEYQVNAGPGEKIEIVIEM